MSKASKDVDNIAHFNDGSYALVYSNPNKARGMRVNDEEDTANAKLILDAFETTTQCGLLPSELYNTNINLIAALKTLYESCKPKTTSNTEGWEYQNAVTPNIPTPEAMKVAKFALDSAMKSFEPKNKA